MGSGEEHKREMHSCCVTLFSTVYAGYEKNFELCKKLSNLWDDEKSIFDDRLNRRTDWKILRVVRCSSDGSVTLAYYVQSELTIKIGKYFVIKKMNLRLFLIISLMTNSKQKLQKFAFNIWLVIKNTVNDDCFLVIFNSCDWGLEICWYC